MDSTKTWYSRLLKSGSSQDNERSSVVSEVMRYHPLSKRMKKILQEKKEIVFLYLDIVRFAELERRFGQRTASDLLHLVETCIRKVSIEMLNNQLIEVENFWGDDFLVCFQHHGPVEERWVYDFSAEFRLEVIREINAARPKLFSSPLDVHIGYSVLGNSTESLDRRLYQTIKRAVKMARKTAKGGDEMLREFQNVLMDKKIHAYFQPIISFEDGKPLGWEALSRGPIGSQFERPDTLFSFAEELGDLYLLERICRERAIERIGDLPEGAKLFLNINPRTIDDPNFTKGETRLLLEQHGLAPSDIVFEITERHSIQDYSAFRKTLEHYRQQGYLIAVDDAGAGYSSLQSIVELSPDFIKMDMSLVRGVSNDPVKQALLEAFVMLARKIRCKIIAEGIENEEEVKTLLSLGIDYGQGFLLGRPRMQIEATIPSSVMQSIERRNHEKQMLQSHSALQIGTIATPTFVISPEMTIKAVHELLENRRQISSVVVALGGIPLGLLTRDHLYALLGSQYGVPLYYRRTVGELMDSHPLTVDHKMQIDEVSAMATNRNNLKRYDDVIVTEGGDYRGVVSVQTLLDTMSKVKIEIAKYANPLTGLPGNLRIEEELRLRVLRGQTFSVIYIDLDKFKEFNDCFGFEFGDQVILFVSELLRRQHRKYCHTNDFIGHIGGDDFVIITTPDRVDQVGKRTVQLFDRMLRLRLQDMKDKGYSDLTISLAAINVPGESDLDPRTIASHAANMKKKAKQIPYSCYVHDTIMVQSHV